VFRINNLLRPYSNSISQNDLWFCNYLKEGKSFEVGIPIKKFPHIVEAIYILSRLDGESERPGRYISVYRAYESVVQQRETDYIAIRHALAHALTQLSRPKIVKSLLKRFGSGNIDFSNYHHQKEFYRCIGQMLIATDIVISKCIEHNWEMME